MSRPVAVLLMLICTAIWGVAFVSQKSAMTTMGPLTFGAVRMLLGGLALSPLALLEYRRNRPSGSPLSRRQWLLIGLMSVVFFLASWLQQTGLVHTTVTNGGFLTSLYVLAVPIIAWFAIRQKPHPAIYLGAPVALIGIYLLNGGLDTFNAGDALVIVSAAFWGGHVFMIGLLARETRLPVVISAVSFLVAGSISTVLAFPLESPTISGVAAGWLQILYAGLFSTAIAYTLQAIAQQHIPPSNSAIILSSESLFAALAGALLLNERLSPLGYAGAALIFLAIIVVEAVPALAARSGQPST